MNLPTLPDLHHALLQAARADHFQRLDSGTTPSDTCLWFHRPGLPGAPALYLSAGIHGDEPAGPLALLHLLQQHSLPNHLHLTLFPLLSPEGYAVQSRTNRHGIDLNRDYRTLTAPETQRHVACLRQLGRFHACLCLHEDWESTGIYLYEVLAPGLDSWAAHLFAATDPILPRDPSPLIDGHPASHGLIAYDATDIARTERPDWPEAFLLTARHTHRCYTLETPSTAPLADRVNAQARAILALAHFLTLAPPPLPKP